MLQLHPALYTALVGIKIDLTENLADGRSHPFAGLLVIILGLCNLCKPEEMWYLGTGWRFQDAEPSEAALLWCRAGGLIAVILGVILML